MEWALIKILLDAVAGISATIGIGQFAYGVARSKKDLREIQQKGELGDEKIYSDQKQRKSLKEIYQALARTAPYAQRVILALQVRTGVLLLITILVMYGLISGILVAGSAIDNNPFVTVTVLAVFIVIVNALIPNLLHGFRGRVKTLSDYKNTDPADLREKLRYLTSKASNRVNRLMRTLGVGAVSSSEVRLIRAYVATLETVRAIEAEELTGSLEAHLNTLAGWTGNSRKVDA